MKRKLICVLMVSILLILMFAFIGCKGGTYNLLEIAYEEDEETGGLKAYVKGSNLDSENRDNFPEEFEFPEEYRDRITKIGRFADYPKLTKITIPKNVKVIEKDAFKKREDLTTLVFEKGSQIETIGENAFNNCPIAALDLPEGLKKIDKYAFYGLPINDLVIPESVEEIGEAAFKDCLRLRTLTYKAKAPIPYLFNYGCTNLQQIDFGTQVESIRQNAFMNCEALTELNLPASLKYIGIGAFENLTEITEVELPENLNQIDNRAFQGCSMLGRVVIPNSVKKVGERIFRDCKNVIVYVESPTRTADWDDSWNLGNRPVIWDYHNNNKDSYGNAYFTIEGVNYRLNVNEDDSTKFDHASVIRSSKVNENIVIKDNIEYEGGTYPVTIISEYAFKNQKQMKTCIIGKNIKQIFDNAFRNCYGLRELTIPEQVETVTGDAFTRCYGLQIKTPISGPKKLWKTSTWPCEVIYNCETNDALEDGTRYGEVGKLRYRFNTDGTAVVNRSDPDKCIGKVEVPRTVTYDGVTYDVVGLGASAFANCTQMTEVVLQDNITVIGYKAFFRCGINKIDLPASVTRLEETCFQEVLNLTEIVIPETVTFMGPRLFSQVYHTFNAYVSIPEQYEPFGQDWFRTDLFGEVAVWVRSDEYKQDCWHYTEDGKIEIWQPAR